MTQSFLLNDQIVTCAELAPEDMLLDHLRLDQRLCGTKEGCAEGDCGACTVLVGRAGADGVDYRPVNACIRPVISVLGCHVVTVEHLERLHNGLSPVQEAMVTHHGSQCGFCTPGIVMSLTGHLMQGGARDGDSLRTALDGNLCRCTGYRPIIDAAAQAENDTALHDRAPQTAEQLSKIQPGPALHCARDGATALRPTTLDELLAHLADQPEARIVAGATDVGLWVTKGLRQIAPAVFIDHLSALRQIEAGEDLILGACVSLSDAAAALAERLPHLAPYMDRFAGPQIRATGTIGGNIANGSPIGDLPPVLIALDTTLTLRSAAGRREIPLEDFFIDYGQQDLRPGEIVERLRIPAQPDALHWAEKVSKRQREDISAVSMGLRLTLEDGIIRAARLAYGGLAATPKRAAQAEGALTGLRWQDADLGDAIAALAQDFTPISDMRATAGYRLRVAGNLLRRAQEGAA